MMHHQDFIQNVGFCETHRAPRVTSCYGYVIIAKNSTCPAENSDQGVPSLSANTELNEC